MHVTDRYLYIKSMSRICSKLLICIYIDTSDRQICIDKTKVQNQLSIFINIRVQVNATDHTFKLQTQAKHDCTK